MNQPNEATPLQRALVAVKDMRARLEAAEAARREPVAIIGLACRLPRAASPQAFWQLLHEGVDAVRPVPAERWDVAACFDARPGTPGKMYTRDGGFLDEVDRFDAAFFRISPREAVSLDPQQRLLLEVSWEAFERAGLTLPDLAASQTGVFVGITTNDYAQLLRAGGDAYLDSYFATGNALNAAAGRLAYFFGLHGPCMAIDSACSSSLTALHLACQSLRAHETDLALVGGVNLILTPDAYIAMCQARTIAPDGRCKTFDARADGYVRGEGCVALVLKRLSDAERDRDPIQALIRGSAVQQDGHSGGLTVPNGAAQQTLLRRALTSAGVAPAQVSYVEAHGTGTTLGDPIEIHALGAVLGEDRAPDHPLLIGAVKTNIGHLEAAAGLAGVLKTTLALQQGTIPPHLHLHQVNPDIDLAAIPAAIPTAATPWRNGQGPRIAGVTAMGLSGTIAHVVLQEAPIDGRSGSAPQPPADGEAHLLLLSARHEAALRHLAAAYHALLAAPIAPSLADVCHLAATRRSHLEHRVAVTGQNHDEMCARLLAFSSGQARSGTHTGHVTSAQAPRVVFVFPGQGSQWAGMGQALLAHEPAFRAAIEACDAALQPFVAFSLVDLFRHPDRSAWLEDISSVQPALFAMQVGLAALWRSWGVAPDAVIGHSMGEVAAATVAGALSLADAARIISRRSQIMQRLCGQGAMALVERSPAEAEALLAGYEDRVAVAVCNSPRSTVLAGDPPALHEIVQRLHAEDVFCRWVKVDVASHSPQIDLLHDELVQALAGIEPRPATISLYSTVTAGECAGEALTTDYWLRNLRQPVRFGDTVQQQLADGYNVFLELSSHPILLPAIEQNCRHVDRPAAVAPSLRRDVDPAITLREAAGMLYTAGCALAWPKILPWSGSWVDLPTYPWQRERFWPEATAAQLPAAPAAATQAGRADAFLGTRVYSPVSTDLTYEAIFSVQTLPFLADHCIDGQVVVPGAAHLARVIAAAHALHPAAAWHLEDVTFPQALILDEQAARPVQLILDPIDGQTFKFQVFSRGAAAAEPVWTLHALGTLIVDQQPWELPAPTPIDDPRSEGSAGASFYQAMWEAGYHLGPAFRWIEQFWAGEGAARARMVSANTVTGATSYPLFPGLLDACFQLVAVTSSAAGVSSIRDSGEIYVPVGVTHLHVPGPVHDAAWCQVQVTPQTVPGQPDVQAHIVLTDDDGRILLDAGFRGRRVPRGSFLQDKTRAREDWFYRLVWVPLEAGRTPGSNAENAARPAEATPRGNPTDGLTASGTPAWLIFADRRGVAEALAQRLAADGTPCVLVESGPAYAASAPGQYVVPPADAAAYRQLLADLDRHYPGQSWGRVVHLWSLDAAGDTPVAPLQPAQDLGCLSVVGLVQALVGSDWPAMPHLCLLTRGAQPVEQPVTLDGLAQAPLWGLARTLFLEHPELPCTCLDVGAMETREDVATLYEALRAPGAENQLALRGHRRYAARLFPCTAELPAAPTSPVRADATYLITGGLGGLGLILAQALVAQGARRLVLMGRRPPSGAAEATLATLRAAGAEVLVQAGDVTQPADVAATIDLCHQPQAPLRGIIHAALVLDDGMLLNLDAARVRRVLAPKVDGAWQLHRLTQDLPLDFFILFSSATGILGSPGQAPYAAGSAFLDALAHHRHAVGLPALSIDWGPWAQVGQAAAQANRGARLAARGFESLAPAAGIAALQRVWGSAWPQVAIIALNAGQWDTVYPQATGWPLLSQLPQRHTPPNTRAAPLRDVLLATPPGWQRRAGLETHLREQIAHVLRQDPSRIDAQTPLMQFGFDSLMALELRNRLEVSLGLTLSATLIWTYPTIASLAPFLADKMLIRLDAGVEEPEPAPAALADLSTADVAALLAQELSTLKQRKAR